MHEKRVPKLIKNRMRVTLNGDVCLKCVFHRLLLSLPCCFQTSVREKCVKNRAKTVFFYESDCDAPVSTRVLFSVALGVVFASILHGCSMIFLSILALKRVLKSM